MKRTGSGLVLATAGALVLGLGIGSAVAGNGNGSPTGKHFNLNIIGVPKGKKADMKNSNGHTIFVHESGKSKIWLCESGVDTKEGCDLVDPDSFQVLDRNATDSDGGLFALPNPDPDGDGTTVYSVFARALGKPGGGSTTTTCATGPGEDGELGTNDDEEVCSVIELELVRDKGRSKFDNVSKYLLYIYADLDGDGVLERLALFDDRAKDYFWDYDNDGLKLAQFRFYECATIVPDADDPNGAQVDTDCFD